MSSVGLYVHVPFCKRKCPYCDFYSLAVCDFPHLLSEYVSGLQREAEIIPPDVRFETAYIGGGTPTVLPVPLFREVLQVVNSLAPRAGELTVEANPGTLDNETLEVLAHFHVNRVSLGIQSLDTQVLATLGRIHTAEDSVRAYHLLRDAGFANVGVDLMFGVPGQTRGSLEATLKQVVAMRPEHVSCYALSVEPDTPWAAKVRSGELGEVSPEEQREQYDLIRQLLKQAGYVHYEISNFALPGFECRHNVNYWLGGEYFGLGPSAHSHWAGRRWSNVRDVTLWAQRLVSGKDVREAEEQLPPMAKARETLILNLRLTQGVSRTEFHRRTGFDYYEVAGEAIRKWVSEGVLIDTGDRLWLHEDYFFVSNYVLSDLV